MSMNSTYIRGTRLVLNCDRSKCKTEQAHKAESDINVIIKRYRKTGVLPLPSVKPQFGDATLMSDFTQAMNLVAEGRSAFERLPAKVRAQFRNDPRLWLADVDKKLAIKKADDERKAKEQEKVPDPNPPKDVK